MLAHHERLRAGEVRDVLAHGRSVRGTYIQMKFLPAPVLRAAAVVPKSLVRKANKRNTLRRALYRALSASPLPRPTVAAVYMVRVAPPEPAAAFAKDIAFLFSKI